MNNFDSNMFYNIARFDISEGLKDVELSSGADFFILLKVPTNANVTVKINSNTNHPIPVREAWQIGSKNELKLYISCDAIYGEEIVIGQHDGNLTIVTNPTIEKIDSITSITNFSNILLNELNKIAEPYNFVSRNSYTSASTSSVAVLSEVLNCDKIRIILNTPSLHPSFSSATAKLDNNILLSTYGWAGASSFYSTPNAELVVENVRGQTLILSSQFNSYATIEKYNLKA